MFIQNVPFGKFYSYHSSRGWKGGEILLAFEHLVLLDQENELAKSLNIYFYFFRIWLWRNEYDSFSLFISYELTIRLVVTKGELITKWMNSLHRVRQKFIYIAFTRNFLHYSFFIIISKNGLFSERIQNQGRNGGSS